MTNIDSAEVGKRIKEIRHTLFPKKISMEKFGKLLDPPADKTLVAKWESGVYIPNNTRLKQIAELSGSSIDSLLYGKQKTGFGKRLREKRESLKISTSELAKYIGAETTEADINSWEKENSVPNENQLIELAVYLSTTISYLLIGEKDEISTNDVYLYSEDSLDIKEKLKNSDLATDKKNKYTLFYRQFQDIILASIDNPNEFESFFNSMNETWNSLDKKNKTN